jgi:hypothetical protein
MTLQIQKALSRSLALLRSSYWAYIEHWKAAVLGSIDVFSKLLNNFTAEAHIGCNIRSKITQK